jgi:hypothetical protein
MEMIRVSVTTTRLEPPAIRNERIDWHGLTDAEQRDVAMYRDDLLSFQGCQVRAQVYLRRHCGA